MKINTRSVVVAMASLLIILGGVVLFGWMARSTTLVQIFSDLAPMQVNTALAFIFCGLSLLMVKPKRKSTAVLILAGAAGLAGFLTLVEYAADLNLGIDTMLFEPWTTTRTSHPGRMSPLTASCFVIAASAFLCGQQTKGSVKIYQIGGLLLCLVSGIVLFGYLVGIESAIGWGEFTRMAAHTALGFFLLGVGLIFTPANSPSSAMPKSLAGLQLPAALALMIALGLVARRSQLDLAAATERRHRSHQFIRLLGDLRVQLRDVQIGTQGLIITGDESFLHAHREVTNSISGLLENLRGLTAGNAVSQAYLDQLTPSVSRLTEWCRATADLRRNEGFEAAQREFATDRGNQLLSDAVALVHRIDEAENRLLTLYDNAVQRGSRDTSLLLMVGNSLTLVLVAAAGWRARREILRRSAGENELRNVVSRLEAILENTSYSIIATNQEGVITTFNRGAEQMLGYAAGEMEKRHTPEVIHDAREIAARAKEFSRILGEPVPIGFGVLVAKTRRGLPNEHEWTYVRKDGSRLPVLLSVTVLRDDHGTIAGFLGIAKDLTEWKSMEAEVLRSSLRLKAATEGARIGVWEWNIATSELVWDETMHRLYGVDPKNFGDAYDDWSRALAPEDLERATQEVGEAIRTRSRFDTSFRIVRPDGAIRHIRASGVLQFDSKGQPQRMIGTNWDITDQRMAEDRIRAGEKLLQQMIKYAPAAIAMVDTQMRYLQASDQWLKDYHLESVEIVGRSHYEVFPDIPDRWKGIHRRVLAGAVERCDEEPFPRADGSLEWLQWECRPWHEASGQIGGLIIFTQAITARKRLEAEKQATEERFRLMVEGISDYAIVFLNPEGRIDSWNEGAQRIHGYAAAEIIGEHFSLFLPDDALRNDHCASVLELAKRHGKYQTEGWRLRKNGSRFWANVLITAILETEGKLKGFSKVTRDLTELRKAEETIKASLAEKEILLREIHHRVKNNMQLICSVLNLQAASIDDERMRTLFSDSRARVMNMAMIHEKLYGSENLATIDFGEHVRDLAQSLVRAYNVTNQRIKLEVNAVVAALDIDTAIPVGLILNELITNSLKYAFPGGRSGTLRVCISSPAPDRLELSVADDGVGLPHNVELGSAESLGLKMVRILTRQIRGKLELRDGKGVSVSISFPRSARENKVQT